MASGKSNSFLSPGEMEFLEALKLTGSIVGASRKCGIQASTGRVKMKEIRDKRVKATNTVNILNNYGRGDVHVAHLLAPIMRNPPQVEQEVPE